VLSVKLETVRRLRPEHPLAVNDIATGNEIRRFRFSFRTFRVFRGREWLFVLLCGETAASHVLSVKG
jgi:hypothetical protein